MIRRPLTAAAILLAGLGAALPAPTIDAAEIRAEVSGQLRLFPERGTLGQDRVQASTAVRLELHHDWNEGRDALTVTPFLRLDSLDGRRTHGDLREAFYSHFGDSVEVHVGARRVFWGRTESRHLVDVINQVDAIEDVDEEDRLGQPMVQLVWLRPAGTLEAFALLGARQRTFPSTDGRLGGPVRIDGDARFTDGAGALDTGWALRWTRFAGPLDFGVAHYSGPARTPRFELRGTPVPGRPIEVRPVYETVALTTLDAQWVVGDTALKLELLNRRGAGPRSTAFVAGVEHTIVGVAGTRADLGLLAEYLFDDAPTAPPRLPFEQDVFLGLRLAPNDLAGTRLLAGVIVDHDTGETFTRLEASRRLGDRWRFSVEATILGGAEAARPGSLDDLLDADARLGAVADDDFLQIELVRYF